MSLDLAAIRAAADRIAPHVKRTPVLTNDALDATAGASLFFKCENLQAMGAFKARGAANAVFSLSDAAAVHGVVTHSSGNHGAAVARAAQRRGIPGFIVMPHNAPQTKIRNVERYGGRIVFCEPNLTAREAACARIAAETGAVLVHPFDDYAVMAGQGTATLELLEQAGALDLVLCPVGGGGLLCGTAIAAKGARPGLRVIGVEPAASDDVAQSFRAKKPISIAHADTIADGLRTNVTGERNLPLILQHVDDIVTVSEDAIVTAMRTLWESLKLVVEPSCAVPFAAIQSGRLDVRGLRVGVILTGGNVDLEKLPWLKK
ncbi:MAG: threonine/serine dehydratase [Candidatus Didemnitutus sp.]|nr:threonine/serine dehydratase [Candidatus Didemnitutus sp.]